MKSLKEIIKENEKADNSINIDSIAPKGSTIELFSGTKVSPGRTNAAIEISKSGLKSQKLTNRVTELILRLGQTSEGEEFTANTVLKNLIYLATIDKVTRRFTDIIINEVIYQLEFNVTKSGYDDYSVDPQISNASIENIKNLIKKMLKNGVR